jgi:hypothetical protein
VTDEAIALLAPRIGTRAACAASGVPQATWYRRHRTSPPPQRPVPVPHADRVQPRALAPAERTAILDVLHSARFADTAPAEIWAMLLDEGTYLGSVSTYYRVLREAGENRERRAQATHPALVKPELVATGPNQVYSWDITKLHGPAKWTYYHLYVILDIYSPVRRGLDGRHPRVRCPRGEADRGDLRQAGHQPRPAQHPRRPRFLDDVQAGRAAARRPGHHPVPLPPARLQRQPVLRSAVQSGSRGALPHPGPLRNRACGSPRTRLKQAARELRAAALGSGVAGAFPCAGRRRASGLWSSRGCRAAGGRGG